MIGECISHFEIREEIGSGGMGVVYLAVDLRLKRKVALKLLHPGALTNRQARERFIIEAQTASALNHRNIVTVYEIDSADGRDFIAMEYVPGEDLKCRLKDQPMQLEDVLRFSLQIADALASAHEGGVVHRDLKPQNVLITETNEAKILDFGLAKKVLPPELEANSDEAATTISTVGEFAGTPAYMSPEQIEGLRVDRRSDIFSFGAVLYQMISGVSPFRRPHPIRVLSAVLNEQPEPLHKVRPTTPKSLIAIVERALQKDPDDRFASMDEVVEEIEALWGDLFGSGVARRPATRELRLSMIGESPAARRWPYTAAGLLLAVIAGLLVWHFSQPPTTSLELQDFRVVSTTSGSHRQPTPSPDGSSLAFVSEDEPGVAQIWLTDLSSKPARQLTFAATSALHPCWDPAGDRLLYEHDGGIWELTPLIGSVPKQLIAFGTTPNFSPDGQSIVFQHDKQLWLAKADGSDPAIVKSVLTNYYAEWVSMAPAFSPDGQQIAFFLPQVGPIGELWVTAADTGPARQVFEEQFRGGSPVWTPDGSALIFESDLGGALTLWSVPQGGGRPTPLTRGAGEDTHPALSPDGKILYYANSRQTYTLSRKAPGAERPTGIFDNRRPIVAPAVSPDGQHVAFFSPVGPDFKLFIVSIEGDDLHNITPTAGEKNFLPQWSADGQHLYYHQLKPTQSFRRISKNGGESEMVLENWRWAERNESRVSPDERSIAYTAFEDGKPLETRIRHLESGDEQRLTTLLRAPRWAPNGDSLVGYSPDFIVYVCSPTNGTCHSITEGYRPKWSHDGEQIIFARPFAEDDIRITKRLQIWHVPQAGGEPQLLTQLDDIRALTFDYDVQPDGTVIWNTFRSGRQELWSARID